MKQTVFSVAPAAESPESQGSEDGESRLSDKNSLSALTP